MTFTAETATGYTVREPKPGDGFIANGPDGEGLYQLLPKDRCQFIRPRAAISDDVWSQLESWLPALDVCVCGSTYMVAEAPCGATAEPMCADCAHEHAASCDTCNELQIAYGDA